MPDELRSEEEADGTSGLVERRERRDLPEDAQVLSRLLAERFSCRAFRPEPVPRAAIEAMLEFAQMTPSWCNSQPWEVIVTEGDATERLRTALFDHASKADYPADTGYQPDVEFPEAYRGVYKQRQRQIGWELYQSVGIERGDREASRLQALENFRLFGAPHALILTSERDFGPYGMVDCGLYLGSLALAAQGLGIGMVLQAALAVYSPLIRAHFGIPENRIILAGASFGFADESHPANSFRSRRAPLRDAVRWQCWRNL